MEARLPNLRIISDNAIDRATLTASSTQGAFGVANLQLARKSDVWRSAAGTTARLSATWAVLEPLQAVAMPHCDLSPTATMRVRVTSEAQATNLLTNPNTFTSGWASSSIAAITTGVAGPDGANSASTLTATGAGATFYQSVSVAAGSYVASVWVRRRTGSGAVSIRNAANTAWIALPLTTSWARYGNDGGTVTSSTLLNLQIASSGDSIDIAFAQVEAGSVATSYYPGTRPLGYIDGWQSYTYDSGAQPACPAPSVTLRGFTAAQSAQAYAFGGGATARLWMPASVAAYGLAVDIVDAGNLLGYIEAAYLVAGPYWEAVINVDYGASATLVDSSKNDRTDAGDLISDAGTMSKRLSLPMSALNPVDRATLWGILRSSGVRYPIFASLFPGHADLALERDHQVYGKLVQLPAMALPRFNIASATVEIESV